MRPGATAFTRMPSEPHSMAICDVSRATAAFVDPYAPAQCVHDQHVDPRIVEQCDDVIGMIDERDIAPGALDDAGQRGSGLHESMGVVGATGENDRARSRHDLDVWPTESTLAGRGK